MKNFKSLIVLLTALTYLVSSNTLFGGSDNPSFATFTNKTNSNFNPFSVTKALGGVTASNYAGSSFFFGDSDDSLWGGSANASGAPDGLVANTFVFPNKKSRYLLVKDFGFNIPCNATITDITFNVTRRNNSDIDGQDVEVRVFNPITLDFSAENNADPSIWLEGGSFETIAYSSATWGEALTPETLNDPRFGLVISVANIEGSGRVEAYVDAVEMVVCYDVNGPISTPITITVEKNDACFDQGTIEINATGGSGDYLYSIDNGVTYQPESLFENLSFGDYIVSVQNSDGTCSTQNFYCNLSGDDRILQAGDMITACATYPGSRVTLAVEKAQPFHDFYTQGLTGTDVSQFLPVHPYEWEVSDLGGEVFSFSLDQNRNIYTGVTTLYDIIPNAMITGTVSKIDAFTGAVTTLTTVPGNLGVGGVEYDTLCNQLFVANLEDGAIYRLDPNTGATLSIFDPLTPDDGAAGYPALGERIIAVAYNYADGRLYYSMWNSDFNMSGIKNTIRSVAIDPATCDFLPGTDQEELQQPWLTEYGDPLNPDMYNMPVGDIVFSADGTSLLLSEVGYDSDSNSAKPHEARILLYNGSAMNWTLSTNVPAGNTNLQHEIGEVSAGLNARGGVDFANAGFDADKCAIENEQFIVATGDALRGANCNTFGCIYGIQYLPISGGQSSNSVILDIGRDFNTQLKSVFGDVDVVKGCQESVFCCPDVASTATDQDVCIGTLPAAVSGMSNADALSLVYHTTIPADSIEVYNNGTVLSTENVVGGSATLTFTGLPVGAAATYYVYVIANPTPGGEYCRPYDSLVVTVRENPTVEISGTALVCVDDDDVTFTGSPIPAGTASGSFTTTATSGLTDNGDGTASLDPSTATAGTYDVTYSYTDEFGCMASATTSIVIDPCFEYDLALAKSVTSMGPYMQGSTIDYNIVVTNQGDIEGVNVEVTDTPPAGLTLVSSSATSNPNITENSPGIYTITSVPVGGSETISLSYTIDMTFMGTSLVNLAQITADNGDDRDSDPDDDENTDDLDDGIDDDDEDEVTVNVGQNYDLSLSKGLMSTGPFSPSDNVVFEITVSNDGSLVGNNIEIVDSAPTGLIYVSDDSGTNANVTSTVSGAWVISTLTPTSSEVITVTYQIDPAFMGMILDNVAEITIDDGNDIDSDPDTSTDVDDLDDGIADDDEDNAMVMVGQVYDLSLTKTVTSPGPFMPGGNITYLLTVSNDGTIDANNTEITDTPAADLTFVSSNASSNANVTETSPGVFNVTLLSAMTSETIEVTYQIASGFMGSSIGNNAQITADDGDDMDSDPDSGPDEDDLDDGIDDDDEDETTVNVGQVYDLSLTKAVSGATTYTPGSNVTYQITISNDGSINANNIVVTDTPGTGLTYVSSDASGNANVTENSAGVWTVTSVLAMSSEIIEVTYQIDPTFTGTTIDNQAQITADDDDDIDSDPDAGFDTDDLDDGIADDDEDEESINVNTNYDIALSKSVVTNGPYNAGDDITFNIVVTNEGSIDATSIEVSEIPNSAFTFVSSSFSANVTETTQGIWSVAALAENATEIITVTYTIDPSFTGTSIVNYVEITADSGIDIDSDPDAGFDTDDLDDGVIDDDEDEVTLDVVQVYDLAMIKTVTSPGPYMPGSSVSYSITVFNDGTLSANNIQVTDSPSSSLLFQSDDSGSNANVTSLGGGVYEFASIASGNSETVNLVFQIDPAFAGGSIGNAGEITADDGDDIDSDPDIGPDQDDYGDGLPDDDEDETSVDIVVNGMLGDFVFLDVNGNGIQDGNEPGVVGVEVNLYNVNGFLVDTEFTNGSGNYLFTELTSGDYYVEIVYPEGMTATFPNQGGNDTTDSDIDNSNGPGTTALINIGNGENDLTVDLGIIECIPVGEIVWFDYNENDVLDGDENGINGIRVELYRQEPQGFILWDFTYTGHKPGSASDDGYYKFCVMPGSYYIRFVNPPQQLVPVIPRVGTNRFTDSDVTGMFGSGTTDLFTVSSGEERCDIGAGFYAMGTIGDYVWMDSNANGMRETNEEGLEGVVVRAIDQTGEVMATAISDEDGRYMLDYLTKSTMFLEFETPNSMQFTQANMGTDETADSDVDGSNGPNTTEYYNVNPGIHIPHIDAGLTFKVLAIDINDLSGEYKGNHNHIQWSIQSEKDISHYTIERSIGGINDFVEIGKILSNSDEQEAVSNYEFLDYDIDLADIYYYRIIQTDIFEKVDYSKIISVEVTEELSSKITLYPNPVYEELMVDIDMDNEISSLKIQLLDKLGKLIKVDLLDVSNIKAGKNQFNINVTDIPNGMYNVKINIDNDIVFKKLIVLKQ